MKTKMVSVEIMEAFHTIKEQYRQIFLISHKSEIKEMFERVLKKLREVQHIPKKRLLYRSHYNLVLDSLTSLNHHPFYSFFASLSSLSLNPHRQ